MLYSAHLPSRSKSIALLGTSRRRYTLHSSKYVLMIGCVRIEDRNCCSASRNNPTNKNHAHMCKGKHRA